MRVFLCLLVTCGLASPAAGQAQELGTDEGLLAAASDIVRGRADANAAWIRKWFTGEFMLVKPDGEALAVLLSSPPPSLAVSDSARVLPESEYVAYLLPAGQPGLPSPSVISEFGERRVVAVPVVDSLFGLRDLRLATTTLVYHEAFHLYQISARWALPSGANQLASGDLVGRDEFQSLAARERAILARALGITRVDSLIAVLRTYVDVRSSRLALLPSYLRTAEAHMERMEASAHLISYRAALLAVEGSDERLFDLIRSDLFGTPGFDDPQREMDSYRHWHIYATGAAIGILLERLGVPWKEPLERGATFWDLLNGALPAA